jgi:pimeloyl-ACP methyl ester carboxylesterase
MSFSYRDETKELDEPARKAAGGSFIHLSDGFTHYELNNPDTEETVVLVHGFSVPSIIFDPTFAFLGRVGFRVVRYDLFGRGFSDRPNTRYNIDLFVGQLNDLLDELRFTRPISLVGLSTGGPITAAFTARFPERVKKLVLIDPVGAKPFVLSRILRLAAMPIVGEAIIALLGSVRLTRKIAGSSVAPENIGEFGSRYITQMEYKGFKRAILSTIRNDMLGSFLDVYEHVGKMDKPVLLFWGRQDRTIPFNHSVALRAAMPNLQFRAVENCGHIPHYEKPEEVNPILLNFLRR